MWHGAAWLVIAFLLALWSLGAWALHAMAQWGTKFAGAAGAPGAVAELAGQASELRLPEWLAAWLPAGAQGQWGAVVSAFTPWVESVMSHAPSLVAWLAPAIWVIWALGGVLLLVLGGGLSAVILLIGRRRPSPSMA